MLRKTSIALAVAAILVTLSSISATPALAACSIYQGGACGQDAVFNRWEPRWRGGYPYENRNVGHGSHGMRGGAYGGGHATSTHSSRTVSGAVLNVYTIERRTCHDWVMRNGVKTYIGSPRAC
jgi:hypothetical protein